MSFEIALVPLRSQISSPDFAILQIGLIEDGDGEDRARFFFRQLAGNRLSSRPLLADPLPRLAFAECWALSAPLSSSQLLLLFVSAPLTPRLWHSPHGFRFLRQKHRWQGPQHLNIGCGLLSFSTD